MEILKYFATISFIITIIIALSIYSSISYIKNLLKSQKKITYKEEIFGIYFLIIFFVTVILSAYFREVDLSSIIFIMGGSGFFYQLKNLKKEKEKLFFSNKLHKGENNNKYNNLIIYLFIANAFIVTIYFIINKSLILDIINFKLEYNLKNIIKIIFSLGTLLLNCLMLFCIYDIMNSRRYLKKLTKSIIHGNKIFKNYNTISCYIIGITKDIYIIKPHAWFCNETTEIPIKSKVVYIRKSKIDLVEQYSNFEISKVESSKIEEEKINETDIQSAKKIKLAPIIISAIIVFTFPFVFKFLYWNIQWPQWISILVGYYGALIGGVATLVAVWTTVKATRKIQEENSITQIKNSNKIFTDEIAKLISKYITDIYSYSYGQQLRDERELHRVNRIIPTETYHLLHIQLANIDIAEELLMKLDEIHNKHCSSNGIKSDHNLLEQIDLLRILTNKFIKNYIKQ